MDKRTTFGIDREPPLLTTNAHTSALPAGKLTTAVHKLSSTVVHGPAGCAALPLHFVLCFIDSETMCNLIDSPSIANALEVDVLETSLPRCIRRGGGQWKEGGGSDVSMHVIDQEQPAVRAWAASSIYKLRSKS